ncbi:MAG: metal-dependent hydrolase [Myxococcales bacterium]|nr:metal-dependent hydrolase [Myxococcales bacterium]
MGLNGIEVTWLGHSTFLIKTPEGETILVDPWLASNPKCPEAFHEASADAILITHGHGDHIGDVFTAHERCSGSIVGIYDLTSWLGSKGVSADKLVGMNKGGTVKVPSLEAVSVSMTDARHSSSFTEEDGTVVYLGDPAGFVVTFSSTTLYIAGDTSLFGDMALIGELYSPDAAILPIGDWFTMDPRQAAMACKMLGVKAAIPCHYGTFPILTGTPEAFKAELDKLNLEVEVLSTEPGGTIS